MSLAIILYICDYTRVFKYFNTLRCVPMHINISTLVVRCTNREYYTTHNTSSNREYYTTHNTYRNHVFNEIDDMG